MTTELLPLCAHGRTRSALQRARIVATYGETGDNVSETARRLGISRNAVYRALGLGKAAAKDDLHS